MGWTSEAVTRGEWSDRWSSQEGYVEVVGQDHNPRQLHFLLGAQLSDCAAKQMHQDGDDVVEANQADLSHRSVLDLEVGAAPLHGVVQLIGGAVLVKDLGVLLGGLSTHLRGGWSTAVPDDPRLDV